MGRGAIPSRRGFSRGAMRHPGVSGITRPFGRLSRGRGQVLHVLLSRSPLASLRRGVPFDLHVLGAPPAFILSQDRTLRPKYLGFEPVRSSQFIADRFRSIHMVLYRKRNFSGPPLGGLAKNKSKLDHFKWFDVCPDATLNVSILAVSGSQGARSAADPVRPGRAARRYIARPEGRRGRESRTPYFVHKLISWLRVAQSHTFGHKPWTDRMTSGILLSTVDIASLYPRRSLLVSPS